MSIVCCAAYEYRVVMSDMCWLVVTEPYAKHLGERPGWYLLNDLVVTRTREADALSFASSWRTPAFVVLTRDPPAAADATAAATDSSLLQPGPSLSDSIFAVDAARKDVTAVQPGELVPGLLVAIDAEFVALEREETETLIDGTNIVAQPSRLALARVRSQLVSLVAFFREGCLLTGYVLLCVGQRLRGSGPLAGKLLMDDYIRPRSPLSTT